MTEQELYDKACVEGKCPECGAPTKLIDRTTMSGNDRRDWGCTACSWTHVFDHGTALWKIMSDANNEPPAS